MLGVADEEDVHAIALERQRSSQEGHRRRHSPSSRKYTLEFFDEIVLAD